MFLDFEVIFDNMVFIIENEIKPVLVVLILRIEVKLYLNRNAL